MQYARFCIIILCRVVLLRFIGPFSCERRLAFGISGLPFVESCVLQIFHLFYLGVVSALSQVEVDCRNCL